jgi:hypothetical protein
VMTNVLCGFFGAGQVGFIDMSQERNYKMKTVRIPAFAFGDFDKVRFITRLRKVLHIGLRDAIQRVDAQDEWFGEVK